MSDPEPLVGILMGSQSDWQTMKHAPLTLDELGIANESRIISAHRKPKRLAEYVGGARERGLKVIVAGAGGAAHLPGVVASLTTLGARRADGEPLAGHGQPAVDRADAGRDPGRHARHRQAAPSARLPGVGPGAARAAEIGRLRNDRHPAGAPACRSFPREPLAQGHGRALRQPAGWRCDRAVMPAIAGSAVLIGSRLRGYEPPPTADVADDPRSCGGMGNSPPTTERGVMVRLVCWNIDKRRKLVEMARSGRASQEAGPPGDGAPRSP